MSLPVFTSLAAAALVMLQLALMMMVGSKRFSLEQGLGDGGHPDLLRAIRRHGNLTENAALFVVTLGFLELQIGSTTAVLGLAASFVVVRLAHAIGLSLGDGANIPRAIGAFGTVLTMGCTALMLAYHTLATTF